MQRRDSDANNCVVELITTMQDQTLGVRAVVAQTNAAQTRLCQWHRIRRTYPPPAQYLPQYKPRTGK